VTQPKITVWIGCDGTFAARAKNDDGTGYDLTGVTLTCQVRRSHDSEDVLVPVAITARSPQSDPDVAGWFDGAYTHADTADLTPGKAAFDVRPVLTDGSVLPPWLSNGVAELKQPTTR
jgi:hypothetical protein